MSIVTNLTKKINIIKNHKAQIKMNINYFIAIKNHLTVNI